MKDSTNKKHRYGYEIVASDILARIIRGEWAKGERIDTIDELEKTYSYSRMTIFKAVQHLSAQGYLSMKRGSGVYVESTNIIRKIGLIFSDDLLQSQSTPYAYTLFKAAEVYFSQHDATTKVYVEKKGETIQEWLPLPELETDLRNGYLDGILTISCNAPVSLMQTDFWKTYKVPHVSLTDHELADYRVLHDITALFEGALDYSLKHKQKKIAVIYPGGANNDQKSIKTILKKKKIDIKPDWFLDDFNAENNPELTGYDQMLRLWQQDDKPDTLIVTDDIIAKGVTLAALRLNINIPEKLLIIAAANKKSGVFYPLPVIKLEYDTNEIINIAGNLLFDLIMNKKCKPASIHIKPQLNDE